MEWLLDVKPIRLFSFYMAALFVLGTWLRLRQYAAIGSLVGRLATRWPRLAGLLLEHRGILLDWRTLRPLVVMLGLLAANSLAGTFIWPGAGMFPLSGLVAVWPLAVLTLALGAAMLAVDLYLLADVAHIDEKAAEVQLQRAEWALHAGLGKAVRVLSLGFVDLRGIVSAEVRTALEAATQWLPDTFRWMAAQAGLRLAFGACLWAAWLIAG